MYTLLWVSWDRMVRNCSITSSFRTCSMLFSSQRHTSMAKLKEPPEWFQGPAAESTEAQMRGPGAGPPVALAAETTLVSQWGPLFALRSWGQTQTILAGKPSKTAGEGTWRPMQQYTKSAGVSVSLVPSPSPWAQLQLRQSCLKCFGLCGFGMVGCLPRLASTSASGRHSCWQLFSSLSWTNTKVWRPKTHTHTHTHTHTSLAQVKCEDTHTN